MNWAFGVFISFVVLQRMWETYRLPARPHGKILYKSSLTILTVLHVVCIVGSTAEFYLEHRSNHFYAVISIVGLVMYIASVLLRNWAKNTLAIHWSLQVEILANHKIVRSGPYRYVRHPAYTAIMMEVISIPLVANAFWVLLFVSVPYIAYLIWRANVEEKALVEAVGESYHTFCREVPQFFPFKKIRSMRT